MRRFIVFPLCPISGQNSETELGIYRKKKENTLSTKKKSKIQEKRKKHAFDQEKRKKTRLRSGKILRKKSSSQSRYPALSSLTFLLL